MKTETPTSPAPKAGVNENKINYLWLGGERVIGIEGLEIFEDCRQMHQLPVIEKEQRDELNSIINITVERYTEEGIYDYLPGLVTKTMDYFSEKGYCVTSEGKIKIELRQSIEVVSPSFSEKSQKRTERFLTVADLWHIQRHGRVRLQRRFI